MIKSVKIVFFIFSILFFIILSSLVYFLVFKSEYYAKHELNRRVYEDRNKFIRGRILDRNNEILVYSEKNDRYQERIYNYGEAFLHPIGYFDNKYGMDGIESYMDEYLREPRGFVSNILKIFDNNDLMGSNVKLTLHKEIQQYAYDILGNNKGAIIVMNPSTGEIYSMISKPSFDPNNIDEVWNEVSKDDNAPLYNRAINGRYAPGSTFKVLTSVASIENIEDIQNRIFLDKGYIAFNQEEKLSNQNEKSYGEINLKEAFVNSSNVVFGELAIELGNKLLKEYAEKFYFNKNIHIEGFSVLKSYFPELQSNEVGLIAQSGIGQGGVLSTPLIMAMMASAVANNGILNNPYIISEILNYNLDIIKKNKPYVLSKVMEQDTSDILKDYMRGVVNENLSHIEEFLTINAAGKTGTADYKKNGIDGIPHSWFIGFAPCDNPIVAVSVIVEEGGEGRGIASYIAAKVMEKAINLLK